MLPIVTKLSLKAFSRGGVARILLLVAMSFFCISVLALYFVQLRPSWTVRMSVSNVVHLDGYEWRADLVNPIPLPLRWLLYIPTDSLYHPRGSNLRVFDSTGELGPAHSLHEDIIKKGGGRFSYWLNSLRFSTRDNLSPDTAAYIRNIKMIVIPVLFPFYKWAAFVIGVYLLFLLALKVIHTRLVQVLALGVKSCHQRRSIGWPIVLIFACADYIHLLHTLPKGILTFSDSGSYLLFSPIVTTGYPLIIHAVIYVLGSPYYIVLIQFAVAAFAITYFCKAIEKRFSAITVIAIGVLMVIKGDTAYLSFSLLTDSFGYSIILVMSALWIGFSCQPRRRSVIGMAVLIIIAVAIRPAIIALIVPTVALTLYYFRFSKQYLFIAVTGCVLACFSNAALRAMTSPWLERGSVDHYLNTVWPLELGTDHTKFWRSAGRGTSMGVWDDLLGQVRLSITPGQRSQYPIETREIAAALATQHAAFENAKSWEEKYVIFSDVRGRQIEGVLKGLYPQTINEPDPCTVLERLCSRLSMETIIDHPLALPEITWIKLAHEITTTLVGSWQAEYNIESTASVGSGLWKERYGLSSGPFNMTSPKGIQYYLDTWIHPLLPAMFVIAIIYSMLFLLLFFRIIPHSDRLFLLSLFGMLCSTYTMMVCLMARPLYRYGMPIAPAYIFLLLGTIELLLRGAYPIAQRPLCHCAQDLKSRIKWSTE